MALATLPLVEVCTIIAKNYVAYARVLARSLSTHHPESRLWTLIIDDFERYIDPEQEPFTVLTPADIDCEPFTYMALRYSVLELSTAVKPWLLRHLMARTGRPITYLDPDIKVFDSLQPLDDAATHHGVALIPHNNQPIPPDGHRPSQVDVMISGVYNLGYVSLAPCPDVDHLLDWWADRLRRDCRVDPHWGYFVDQRWFDLAPGFLTDFAIVRDPQYNVAYWNLHSRRLEHDGEHYRVDGRPLAFFHFSGFDATQPASLSRYQDRIDPTEHPVLERLLIEYAREVMDEGHAVSRRWPYGYRALGDGTEIDALVRSFSEEFEDDHERRQLAPDSVFTPGGANAFFAWLAEEAPAGPPGVNRVLAKLYRDRADLQLAFPDPAGADRERLLSWAAELGRKDCPLLDKAAVAANGAGVGRAAVAPETNRPAASRKGLAPLPASPWGMNIVGYFHSQEEIGELARQFVSMCDQEGIPSAPVQDWSIPLIEEGQPFATLAPDDAPYVVNLICTATDALSEFAKAAGASFFGGRYSIALASSDSPPPPHELDLVQEVWVPSAHVRTAIAPVADVPIVSIPVPVGPAPLFPRSRPELGLPDEYLFLLSIGKADDLERTNPLAAIDSFALAFSADEPVRLLLSCGRGGEEVAEVRAAAARHPRIQMLDTATSRQATLELMSACDCYVSLHRAQSFGLSLAEAMWLGKPVIATRYSGNLEFMTDENSLLVDHRLVARDSAATADAVWAEPDIEHAASLMRQVVEDAGLSHTIGDRAASDIRRTHSPGAAASVIKRRLEGIRASGQAPPPVLGPRRWGALAKVQATISRGPAPGPRAGRHLRLRGLVRKSVLRALRPYSSYQEKVNMALLEAIGPTEGGVSVEQAQLLTELRGARQLRAVVEAHGRGLEDLSRRMSLSSDRSLYLALAELGRRHALIGPMPGAAPEDLGLANFELRGYSQNGEDGVIAEILRRIGVDQPFFVEFGVESGIEGNCVYLADVAGWAGLFMEADEQMYRLLERKYRGREGVQTVQSMVTPENIEELLDAASVPQQLDVLSIDVDGEDYWIWQAITGHRPRVVVIEYNSALDPRRRLVQPRGVGGWDGTDYFGASLGAVRTLGEEKGYQLVHTELAGSNAFFVREDLAANRFSDPATVPIRGIPNYYQTGYRHPPDELQRRFLDLDSGELVAKDA